MKRYIRSEYHPYFPPRGSDARTVRDAITREEIDWRNPSGSGQVLLSGTIPSRKDNCVFEIYDTAPNMTGKILADGQPILNFDVTKIMTDPKSADYKNISRFVNAADPSKLRADALPRKIDFYIEAIDNDDGATDKSDQFNYYYQLGPERPDRIIRYVSSKDRARVKEAIDKNPDNIPILVDKFHKYVKERQQAYHFDIDRAIRACRAELINNPSHYFRNADGSRSDMNERQQGRYISECIDALSEQGLSKEELYDILSTAVANWDSIRFVSSKYVDPKEIGKQRTSDVWNSSFTTYYYDRVNMTIAGHPVEFIHTTSEYYSGGWN